LKKFYPENFWYSDHPRVTERAIKAYLGQYPDEQRTVGVFRKILCEEFGKLDEKACLAYQTKANAAKKMAEAAGKLEGESQTKSVPSFNAIIGAHFW
jgi:hypothetical protein